MKADFRIKKNMLLYIADCYRNKNGRTVEEHIQIVRNIAVELWKSGHYALAPHLNTANFQNDAPGIADEIWLAGTMEMLRRCDAIVMGPNWKESEGAIAELEYAESVGMPVFYWDVLQAHGTTIPLNLTEQRCPEQCRAFLDTVMAMYRLHLSKNSDYSPANILGTGEIGLITRTWDKVARLLNLYGFDIKIESSTHCEPRSPKHESINDTWIDLAVYAVIGQLLRNNLWGK